MELMAIGVVGYLLVMFYVGIYYRNRAGKSIDHFLLGNRELPWWMASISERASAMSGYWTLGYPGQGVTTGIATVFAGFGCVIAAMMNWCMIAKRIRRLSEKYDVLTLPDLFAVRVRDNTGTVRIVAALIIVLFMSVYLSSQLVAQGKVFTAVFNIPFTYSVIIGALSILFYTLLGGFFAVVVTDVIQGMLMMFVIIGVPIYVMAKVGIIDVLSAAAAIKPSLAMIGGGKSGMAAFSLLLGLFAIGLPAFGQPHIINRLMSINNVEDSKNIKRSLTVASAMDYFATYFAVFIGLLAVVLYAKMPDPENAVFYLIKDHVHPLLGGVFVAGILAAIMSTANSFLLVVAGELIDTLYRRSFKKDLEQSKTVLYTRLVMLPIIIITVYGAIKGGSVFYLVLYAYGGIGAARPYCSARYITKS